jgi:hypothetical protein
MKNSIGTPLRLLTSAATYGYSFWSEDNPNTEEGEPRISRTRPP